jgi:hypothetical protein
MRVVVNSKWAFIAAVICFGIFFVLPSHPKYISLLGWMLFSYAYILVRRERRVWTDTQRTWTANSSR